MFEIGKCYSREAIAKELGGSTEFYMPYKDGRVITACLQEKFYHNPPFLILPGHEDRVVMAANMLIEQDDSIPIFIHQRDAEWEFMGFFEVGHVSRQLEEIRKFQELTGRIESKDRVSMVIHMRQVAG